MPERDQTILSPSEKMIRAARRLERERDHARERVTDLTEILRRTVKYGQAWLDANPDNERFRRRQCQAMIETARSALERQDEEREPMPDWTPGPWTTSATADAWRENATYRNIVAAAPKREGASTPVIADLRCGPEDRSFETTSANAHLIAAAPDLVEALEAMLGIVNNSEGVTGWHLNGDVAAWDEFEEVAIALAALAKARGERDA